MYGLRLMIWGTQRNATMESYVVRKSADDIFTRNCSLPRTLQLRSFLEGVVNRSSLMVNGASAEQAIVRSVMLKMPVGVHLNVTEGTPISPADKVKSLLQPPEGTSFRGKHGFRAALRAGEVDERELRLEV